MRIKVIANLFSLPFSSKISARTRMAECELVRWLRALAQIDIEQHSTNADRQSTKQKTPFDRTWESAVAVALAAHYSTLWCYVVRCACSCSTRQPQCTRALRLAASHKIRLTQFTKINRFFFIIVSWSACCAPLLFLYDALLVLNKKNKLIYILEVCCFFFVGFSLLRYVFNYDK